MELESRTREEIEEAHKLKDVVHAQHGLVLVRLSKYFADELHLYINDAEAKSAYEQCLAKAAAALEYYDELLPSKGFWGRVCSRQMSTIKRLERELDQQRFNNKHNLSIDQKIADKIADLELTQKKCTKLFREIRAYRNDSDHVRTLAQTGNDILPGYSDEELKDL